MGYIAATLSLNVPAITAVCKGPRGGIVLRGVGAPTISVGLSGDYYIDELTAMFYGPKGDNWPSTPFITLSYPTSAEPYSIVGSNTAVIVPRYGNNTIKSTSINSAILGGTNNSLTGNNSFIIGSNIIAAITGFTLVNNLSSTGTIYASSGNSNQWNTTYQTVYDNKDTWNQIIPVNTTLAAQSANNISVYSSVNTTSGNWNSVYSSYYSNSGTFLTNTSAASLYQNIQLTPFTFISSTSSINTLVGSNTATGKLSKVLGGSYNTASGNCSTIVGGYSGCTSDDHAVVIGGCSNTASGSYSTIVNGNSGRASGGSSSIIGGYYNSTSGYASLIAGGVSNTVDNTGSYSIIGNGRNNTISKCHSIIGSGVNNSVSACFSFIVGGSANQILGNYSSVLGGMRNTASGNYSFIAGGRSNNTKYDNTFILGSSLSASQANTTYVNSISSQGNALVAGSIGINVSSPSEKLHVQGGNILIKPVSWDSGKNSGSLLFGDTNNGISNQYGQPLALSGYNGISFSVGQGTGSWLQNTVNISNSGSVGIGTAPSAPLHINTSNYGAILLGDNTNGSSFVITKESIDNSFNIWTNVFESGTNRLKIEQTGNTILTPNGGNIGINEVSPKYKLDVKVTPGLGNTTGNQISALRLSTTVSTNDNLEITNTRTAAGADWNTAGWRLQEKTNNAWMGWMQFNGYNNPGGITFGAGQSTSSPTSVTEKMRLDQNGALTVTSTISTGSSIAAGSNWRTVTSDYSIQDTDCGGIVALSSNTNSIIVTIPNNNFRTGHQTTFIRAGLSAVTISTGAGVTIRKATGLGLSLTSQWSAATIVYSGIPSAGWVLFGDLL